jgi:hypothetical protein
MRSSIAFRVTPEPGGTIPTPTGWVDYDPQDGAEAYASEVEHIVATDPLDEAIE